MKHRPNIKYIECPICHSSTFEYVSYTGEVWGAFVEVEQHGYCSRCGYAVEQCYSPVYECFSDISKGFKAGKRYIEKDVKKHKRVRRKLIKEGINIKGIEVNPPWSRYIRRKMNDR